jgi:hypothetical protein
MTVVKMNSIKQGTSWPAENYQRLKEDFVPVSHKLNHESRAKASLVQVNGQHWSASCFQSHSGFGGDENQLPFSPLTEEVCLVTCLDLTAML